MTGVQTCALPIYENAVSSSGLAGGALGCIAGWGLAKAIGVMLFDAPLNFAWIVVPCVLVIAVLIALIGTWFPARRSYDARLYRADHA